MTVLVLVRSRPIHHIVVNLLILCAMKDLTHLVTVVSILIKVTMNKLCGHLFIIIFINLYRKSEYIPTVTNFASILANGFYFLRKITALGLPY